MCLYLFHKVAPEETDVVQVHNPGIHFPSFFIQHDHNVVVVAVTAVAIQTDPEEQPEVSLQIVPGYCVVHVLSFRHHNLFVAWECWNTKKGNFPTKTTECMDSAWLESKSNILRSYQSILEPEAIWVQE